MFGRERERKRQVVNETRSTPAALSSALTGIYGELDHIGGLDHVYDTGQTFLGNWDRLRFYYPAFDRQITELQTVFHGILELRGEETEETQGVFPHITEPSTRRFLHDMLLLRVVNKSEYLEGESSRLALEEGLDIAQELEAAGFDQTNPPTVEGILMGYLEGKLSIIPASPAVIDLTEQPAPEEIV